MTESEPLDVLRYYATHYRPGMVDLSTSTPVALASDFDSAYPAPGGDPALRRVIAEQLYPGLGPENIVVTNGASEALAAAALAFIGAGDAVSVVPAAYPSFRRMAERLGARIVESADSVAGSRVSLVNNPTVPDARFLDLNPWFEQAARDGARLVCDEVYLCAGDPGKAPAALLSTTAISIGDVSKPLGLGGLRIGWAVSQDLEATARIRDQVNLLSGGPSTPAMARAAEALRGFRDDSARLRETALANGTHLFGLLASAGWTWSAPQAGWSFLAQPPAPLSGEVERELRCHGYFLLPATAFGITEGYRVSLFADPEHLRRALELCGAPEMMRPGLVVLAKSVAGGASKTRLAARLGDESTRELARAFLADTITTAETSGLDISLAFTPAEALAEFARMAPSAQLHPQPPGDLGVRIRAALEEALEGHETAMLIGSDTPHLTQAVINAAAAALRTSRLVLGPATDGGFYLIGTRGPLPDGLFERVAWSTSTVLQTVLANAAQQGLEPVLLDPLEDIDDVESLERARATRGFAEAAPQTHRALARLSLGSAV